MSHRIVVLLLEPVVGFDAVIAPQLFGEALDDAGRPLYEVLVASMGARTVRSEHGYDLVPAVDESALAAADTVIVPGTLLSGPRRDGSLPEDVRAAFATLRPGVRVMSICTGAFVLAALGVLDGRRATTHWQRAELMRSLYPRVDVVENELYVDTGDVLTSAGLAAGVDLCLHVIRTDHGVEVANRVARHCVVAPWRDGGQAQFIERAVPAPSADTTAAARHWALDHLGSDIDVARLAATARMSVRTFNRRFRDETAQSPGAWLARQRLDRARELLETTDLAVDDVARRSGLGTGASLRSRMRDQVGLSPAAYRRTFRGAPVSPVDSAQ